MDRLLHEKARQLSMFVKVLLETGDACLVENTINDYWGRVKKFTGRNELGNLEFYLLEELRSQAPLGWPQQSDAVAISIIFS